MAKAPVGKRIIAYIIDAVVMFAIIMVLGLGGFLASMLLGIVLTRFIGAAGMLMMFLGFIPYLVALLLALGYWLLRDGFFGGRSLGKKFMGLKVVKDGGRCTYVDSLKRNITLVIPLVNLIDLILGLVDAEGKRIGDKIAGTQVVEA